LTEEAFSYRVVKGGEVFITWQGRVVTTLTGERASKFVRDVEADPSRAQLLMQRATGNFKHGNERR
jgi:antitoxin (DNA-binding transcriptional repressor) of toxin-antitoxin stability system